MYVSMSNYVDSFQSRIRLKVEWDLINYAYIKLYGTCQIYMPSSSYESSSCFTLSPTLDSMSLSLNEPSERGLKFHCSVICISG